jgi:small GTP-binding protein
MTSLPKVVLLGPSEVGKTALFGRLTMGDYFGDSPPTISGSGSLVSTHTSSGVVVKFTLWDTAGQEQFRSMTQFYVRDSAAAILVFDLTDQRSLEDLEHWFRVVREETPAASVVIVGNKADLEESRTVSASEATEFAERLGDLPFVETSAKTGMGVSQVLEFVVNALTGVEEGKGAGAREMPPTVELTMRSSSKRDESTGNSCC